MEFKLSTQDLFHLIYVRKKQLFITILICALGLSLYTLTRPIRYLAEGSFREKGKSNSSFDTKAAMVLIGGGGQKESEGEPIFKSRRVVTGVVKKLGLQAVVEPGPLEPGLISRFLRNLWIECAAFKNVDEPLFKDPIAPFKIRDLDYPHDMRRSFSLVVKEGQVYLKDKITGQKFQGSLGAPLSGDTFTVTFLPQQIVVGQIYSFTLLPITKVIKDFISCLKMQTDKNDKSLIKFSFTSKDRFLAKEALDELMRSYLCYLEEEQQVIHEKQIGYLEERQTESFVALKKKMELHAQELAKDALNHGFIGSDKAIQFFAAHQEQLQAKREQADLLIKGLREVVHQDSVPIERLLGVIDLPALTSKVQQLSDMRTFRDSLSLALWDPGAELDVEQFASRVKQWEDLQAEGEAIDRLIVLLEERGQVESSDLFEGKTKFFINFWQDQISKSLAAFQAGSKENYYPLFNDFCHKKESFKNTLQSLKNFIDVQSTTLQEELVHSKEVGEELKGIDLSLSQDLFKRYMTQLEELQAQERHLAFLKEQIKNEEFAISSLSSILQETLAQEIVQRAGTLELAIRDPKNRSEKEQQRMRDELALERGFLGMHLEQTLELNKIKQNLLQEKFTTLQRATLSFLHRQISFMEHQVKDFVQSKIESLEQERDLYQEQIQNLGDQLATYPEKWVRDELLKQAMQLQQMQAQEITRIVENKNITSNLELIQSSPLDSSFAPPLPLVPMVPLFAFLGALLGLIAGICAILISVVRNGVPATRRNLELQGQKVLGFLIDPNRDSSTFLDDDLETFRSLFIHIGSSVLIAGVDAFWAQRFAEYLRQAEKKVLYIDLNPHSPYTEEGLYHYFKTAEKPKIRGDRVAFDGTTRSYLELFSQERFRQLLQEYEKEYDTVVISISAPPYSAAVGYLSTLVKSSIFSIKNETLEKLQGLFARANCFFILS